jgi:hypothetical protein
MTVASAMALTQVKELDWIPTAPVPPVSTSAHVTLPSFGSARREDGRIMFVAVDPKDVVAVPTDYDNARMRVCRYAIVGEVPKEDAAHAFEGLSCIDPTNPWINFGSRRECSCCDDVLGGCIAAKSIRRRHQVDAGTCRQDLCFQSRDLL